MWFCLVLFRFTLDGGCVLIVIWFACELLILWLLVFGGFLAVGLVLHLVCLLFVCCGLLRGCVCCLVGLDVAGVSIGWVYLVIGYW